jgi:hypothetical protein
MLAAMQMARRDAKKEVERLKVQISSYDGYLPPSLVRVCVGATLLEPVAASRQ